MRKRKLHKNYAHYNLCADLADAKGTIYIECPLGGVWSARIAKRRDKWNIEQDPQRADVVCFKPSYTRFCIDIYECKVQRADFLKDIRTRKWEGYLPFCNRFYFAVKQGVAKKDEIPDPAGLIVRGERGWTTIKRSEPRDIEYDIDFLLALLFYRQKEARRVHHRWWFSHDSYSRDKFILKIFGRELGFQIASHLDKKIDEKLKAVGW